MRLFYSPDRPTAGAVLTLNANVTSLTGEPLLDGAVIAQITAPSGKTASIRLPPAGEDAWGLFTGTFTPAEPGEHRVRLTCADAGSALDAVISVQGTSREKRGQPAKFDVLQEVAQLTRGRMMETADPAAIAALPQPQLEERRVQLWAPPAWRAASSFCSAFSGSAGKQRDRFETYGSGKSWRSKRPGMSTKCASGEINVARTRIAQAAMTRSVTGGHLPLRPKFHPMSLTCRHIFASVGTSGMMSKNASISALNRRFEMPRKTSARTTPQL